MDKKTAVAVAVIVGLIAVAAPIAIALYWSWRQSYNEEMTLVGALSDDALRRSNESTEQTFAIFRRIEAAGAADPCSEQNIRLMALLDLESEQVQAVGYVKGDRLLCSSYGRHDTPVGPPLYTSALGAHVRPDVKFPILPGRNFVLMTHAASGYSAAILADLPLDVFVDQPDVSAGVYSLVGRHLMIKRGAFNAEWIRRLGAAQRVEFSDGKYLVVAQRSQPAGFAVYAAMPAARVDEGLRRTAKVLVPVGVAAGIILALAALSLTRQLVALPMVIKTALRRNEFFLLYQPIVELGSGRCVGAEALIRWRRPDGEMIRPDAFIPVAEQTGQIREITRRVMQLVARDCASLVERHRDIHIGINLSPFELQSADTPQLLRQLIAAMSAEPRNVLVEVTERGLMEMEAARTAIDNLRTLDIRVAIDDFGTGYSSLAYLEKLRLDYLKIDKSFVDTMGGEAPSSQVALHIIEMAKSLNLEMIAEGVETQAQHRFLQERGVQYAQGFYFGRPMPVAELAAYIASTAKVAA